MTKKITQFFPTGAKAPVGVKRRQEEKQTIDAATTVLESEQAEIDQVVEQHVLTQQTISFQDIPLDRIRSNPFQARTDLETEESEEDIQELAQSIREHGFVSVLFVRPDPTEEGYFQLAYGERRWRAAKLVEGLEAIPCRIAAYSDEQMEDIGLIENMQRKALNPIDEALALQRKMNRIDPKTEKPYSIRGLADHLGLKRHRIEEPLRLCEIPTDVQIMVRRRADTVRVAYEIAKLPIPDLRQQLIDKVLQHGVNTREVIYLVNQLLQEQQQTVKSATPRTALASTTEGTILTSEEESQGEQAVPSPRIQNSEAAMASVDTSENEERQVAEVSVYPGGDQSQVSSLPVLPISTATAASAEQPFERVGAPSTEASVGFSARVAPSVVSLAQRLQEKKTNEDSKIVLATIKRWSLWAKEGTYDKTLLQDHVMRWLMELQDLNRLLQPQEVEVLICTEEDE